MLQNSTSYFFSLTVFWLLSPMVIFYIFQSSGFLVIWSSGFNLRTQLAQNERVTAIIYKNQTKECQIMFDTELLSSIITGTKLVKTGQKRGVKACIVQWGSEYWT